MSLLIFTVHGVLILLLLRAQSESSHTLHVPQDRGCPEHLQCHCNFMSWNFVCYSSCSPKALARILQQTIANNGIFSMSPA